MNPPHVSMLPPFEGQEPPAASGRIGWTCAYVPLEIFLAADLTPFRIIGDHSGRSPLADAFLHPGTCRFAAGYLESILAGENRSMAGFVAADACVPARRVLDILSRHQTLPFLYQLNVPNTASESAVDFFKGEIKRLIQAVESFFGKAVSNERLQGAIRETNALRVLWRAATRLRSLRPPALDGTTALDLLLTTLRTSPTQGIQLMKRQLATRQNHTEPNGDPGLRVLLTGSVLDDPSFVYLVESCGGLVVAEDLCLGPALYRNDINRKSDPVDALARYYLGRNACPTIHPVEDRLKELRTLIQACQVDAVIHQHLSGCHLHNGMTPLIQKQLNRLGVPFLHLTRDEGPEGTEQLRTRTEAFFEIIKDNR